MSCSIFNKPLLLDTKNINSGTIDLEWLKNLIPEYDESVSGVWQPIWIDAGQSQIRYSEPLMRARTGPVTSFSPCNCSDANLDQDTLDEQIDSYNICDYCGDYTVNWKLYDRQDNSSPRSYSASCCNGACDTRSLVDDFIPKIPLLNQSYLTGVYDSKYHKEFPACNNPGLGKERFITIDSDNRTKILGPELCIDWKLKETISEVPYDLLTSHHDSEYLHNKSYQKSKLVSSTCGNFILLNLPTGELDDNWYQKKYSILSGLIGTKITNDTPNPIIPTPLQFSELPYGIDEEKHKNIFIKNQKLGSFWKWDYGSGILGWYRYFDKDIPSNKDTRPIPGIDLYISKGDMFFAKNDGPEPETSLSDPLSVNNLVQSCPSGLKILKGTSMECIIPSGSDFCYISNNIYPKFYEIYSVLYKKLPYIDAFKTSAILATSPSYDQITVDLLKENFLYSYSRNIYQQIDLFNKQMTKTTKYDSVSRLNFISSKIELINTLANKYGAYLWIPPDTTQDITFDSSINSSFALDLDFDMVIKNTDAKWQSNICSPIRGCYERTLRKSFSYSQSIGFPGSTISTEINDDIRYSNNCENGTIVSDNYGIFSSIYINESKIKSVLTSSGCITFQDIYPRIANEQTSVFCRDCDNYSSFYLIPDAENVECGRFDGSESFCYSTLARRLNNSAGANITQTRLEREISDGTIRWKRGYKSLFFNPHIDLLAFHQQGGIFVNSVPFGLDNFTAFEKNATNQNIDINQITISFTTNDVGIKIYNIVAEYLQTNSASTAKCKRFPVKNSCQCLPISVSTTHPISCDDPDPSKFSTSNVFTPGLSTRFTPRLKQYGGYSQSYLDSIFGTDTIKAGTNLPILDYKINALNPYGCDTNAAITLYNYTNTTWDLSLRNFSTNHADVYAGVSENVNFLTNRYNPIYYSDYTLRELRPVENFRRFTTKVMINDKNIYANQNIVVYSNDSSIPNNIKIKLQNPFLASAIQAGGGEAESVLYPPSGQLLYNQIFNTSTTPGGDRARGDESAQVNIVLTQKYRKQILNFVIPPPAAMGNLSKGFFHPNSGLTSSIKDKTPIKNSGIFYDKAISPDEDFDSGFCLYGLMNNRVINSINSIGSFDKHKKPRLYFQIQGKWYEYDNPNRGGFKSNNEIYIGKPAIFEYLSDKQKSKNLPATAPSIPKQHIEFNYLYNHYNYNLNKSPGFPLLSNKFSYTVSNPKEIIIPGIRHYFMVPETDGARVTNLDSIEDIGSFNPTEPLTYGELITFTDGSYWLCIKPDNPNQRSSYIWTGYDYLYHNFSDVHIDFSRVSKQGYVYNTKKPCASIPFSTYNSKNNQWDSANTILSKKILVKFVKKDGTPVRNFAKEDVYMIPYTVFETSLPIRNLDYNIIDILGSFNTETDRQLHSFVLTSITAPVAESDTLLLNNFIPSKWGDVINYDGTILDEYTNIFINLYDFYPIPTYNNDFYKIIVNNHRKLNHTYKIVFKNKDANSELIFKHNDLVYYNILQKYGIGDNQPYSLQYRRYHNYLPFMDLNILTSGDVLSAPPGEDFIDVIQNSIENNTPLTGSISIGNMLQTTKDFDGSYINPDSDKYFWINFDNINSRAKSAFVPQEIIYSNTLRIDDPPYWLYSTSVRTEDVPLEDGDLECRETFEPQNIEPYQASTTRFDNSSSFSFRTISRNNPYLKYPIYCDTDDNSCDNLGCFKGFNPGISQVGWKEARATYRVGSSNTVNIPDNVPFMLSYEAGIYNIIGNDSLIKIKRFELSPNNEIEFDTSNCSDSQVFPLNYKASVINPIYQKTLAESQDISHDTIVKNTDTVANEMLFRILYGENQTINKKMLFIDNKILSKNDLIKYSEPKIEAIDIYDQILYNFDNIAPMTNLNLNGTFGINGVLTVGSVTNINIGNINSTLRVVRDNGKIYIRGNIGNTIIPDKDILIHTEYTDRSNYLIQSWSRDNNAPTPPSPANANTTINFVGSCHIKGRRNFGLISFADNGYPEYGQAVLSNFPNIAALSVSKPSYNGAEEYYSTGGDGDCCCGPAGPCGAICTIPSITSLSPKWWGLQYVCGEPTYGAINFVPATYRDISYRCANNNPPYTSGNDNCAGFDFGYCSKKDCPTCEETLESKQEINFEYGFEYCRTRFHLYGHAYRERHKQLPTREIVPAEETIVNSVKELEEWTKNHSPTGHEDVAIAQPDGTIITQCRITIGRPPDCPVDHPGAHFGCPPCGCYVSVDGQIKPCDHCVQGSFFREPNMWPGETFCENNKDYCGVWVSGDREIATYRNIYLQKERVYNTQYNPLCANLLVNINYTSKSITFNIFGHIICLSSSFDSCPIINIDSTMSQLNVSDSITSECSTCSPALAQISLSTQTQSFMTIKEKRRCILGYRYINNVNRQGITGFSEIYRNDAAFGGRGYQVGGQGFSHQCGTGDPVEYGCYEFGQVIYDWVENFMGITVQCNIGLPGDVPESVAAFDIPEWIWELSEIQKSRYDFLGDGSAHIPENDIIEGVVPGSVSSVQVDSYNMGGSKRTRGGDIINGVLTAYVAYYDYDYIRPINIQDILRNDNSILCVNGREYSGSISSNLKKILNTSDPQTAVIAQQTLSSCQTTPFPPNYKDNFSLFKRTYFYYAEAGNIRESSYTITDPLYKKNSDCDTAVSCDYKHEVYVCPDNVCCFADIGVIDNSSPKQSCGMPYIFGTWPPPPGAW